MAPVVEALELGADVAGYDDVCSSGLQLDAVGRRLKAAGAATVVGLVLARGL